MFFMIFSYMEYVSCVSFLNSLSLHDIQKHTAYICLPLLNVFTPKQKCTCIHSITFFEYLTCCHAYRMQN